LIEANALPLSQTATPAKPPYHEKCMWKFLIHDAKHQNEISSFSTFVNLHRTTFSNYTECFIVWVFSVTDYSQQPIILQATLLSVQKN